MNDLKEQIRSANPIQEVIGEVVPLDKSFKGKCPFHDDSTPSFSVNLKDQYFHCFGCGAGGDVFSFVMRNQNLEFKEAMKNLAGRKGISIPENNHGFHSENHNHSIRSVLSETAKTYHEKLPTEVRAYLNGRGITDETISGFMIGFCDGETVLKSNHDDLVLAGIVYENSGAQYFKGFITFPHFYMGQVVYMTGRGYPEKAHKKLQTEKIPLEHLFNEQAAKQSSVILAEGEIDTYSLLQHGFNGCGVLGASSFKKEWVSKLDGCEKVYICFDTDEAGRKASLEIAQLLGKKARLVALPSEGMDINVFFRNHSAEEYRTLLDNSKSYIEFLITSIPADLPRPQLSERLEPIFTELLTLETHEADMILRHTIKDHFELTAKDIQSFETHLKDLRQKSNAAETKQPVTKRKVIELLQEEQFKETIHPAQDFHKGKMSFSVKAKDSFCLVTSDRKIIPFEDAYENGISLRQATIDFSRFSLPGVLAFVEKNQEVDIPELFARIINFINRFIIFPNPAYASLLTLWIMGTYCFMIFRYYPYVWLNAEKGSGKTLLMEILATLAFNGQLITSPTEAVIFRDISNNLITMFIDEVEQLRKRDKDVYGSLISILNAGFNKSGMVKRAEHTGKGQIIIRDFYAYSPKMFAGINDIDDVLQDRTIRIPLLRKKDNEQLERYKETPEIQNFQRTLRDDLYTFSLLYGPQVATLYHTDTIFGANHLGNRELDIWEPIFALANIVDAASNEVKLTPLMTELSKESVKEKQAENVSQNETYKLLTVLKTMLDDLENEAVDGDTIIFDAEKVLKYFQDTEEFEWLDKTNRLTRRLKKVKVRSDQRRRADGDKYRVYLINRKEFTDLCERFKI